MPENKKGGSSSAKTTKKQGSLPGVDMSKVIPSSPFIVKEGSQHLYTKRYSAGKK